MKILIPASKCSASQKVLHSFSANGLRGYEKQHSTATSVIPLRTNPPSIEILGVLGVKQV